jgi:predicted nucleic acid-binding protein
LTEAKSPLSLRKTDLKIVIDSYAWIEQFTASVGASRVKKVLEDADVLYTPGIVLAEVARKYLRDGVADSTVKIRLEQIADNSLIVNLNPDLAFRSAKCYPELAENARKNKLNTPSLADAIILATARAFNAKILTRDRHFKPLPETVLI